MGSDVLGLIHFNDPRFAQMIGILALIVILFEGGLQTNLKTLKPVILPSLLLATFGVLVHSVITAAAAKFLLDVDWLEALLVGAIVGSTDAAAVFSVLKGQHIDERLTTTLEAESGSNDPMAVFLTIAMIELVLEPDMNLWSLLMSFFLEMGLGAILGFSFGKIAAISLNRVHLNANGLYPVFAIAFAWITYGLTSILGGSGLFAVYILGIIIGNAEIHYRHSIFRFTEGFSWMMQMSMFMILGLLVFPSELFIWPVFWRGMILSLLLIFIARPLAVFASTIRMGFLWKERVFLSWAGLKGAVPIVLATYPLLAEIEGSRMIFNIVFFVVLTSCLIQGSTLVPLAKKLKLMAKSK